MENRDEHDFLTALYREGVTEAEMRMVSKSPLVATLAAAEISRLCKEHEKCLKGQGSCDPISYHTLHTVTGYFAANRKLTMPLLQGPRRTQALSWQRHELMYLMRQVTPASLSEIGRFLGRRDHTTIMHGIKMVKARMTEDQICAARIKQDLENLKSLLRPSQ